MAAYAALASLMNTILHIKIHPRPPVSLDETQVESLSEKITSLQQFLESYSLHFGHTKNADPLEMRIAGAAYAAEDVIESHIVEQVRARSTSKTSFFKCFRGPEKAATDEVSSSDQFYQSLQKVIQDMDSIKKEAMEIEEKTGGRDQLPRSSMPAGSSLRSSSTGQNMTMVGFDDILIEVMDKLTGGQLDRHIISIVGMSGTGKTTLARNVYQHQVVVQHFDFLAWVTVSQEYRMKEILLELLPEGGQNLREVDEHKLGDLLHKTLSGRRYLIIVDDIWDIEVWDQLRRFFPDNKNGSRIVMTSRISDFESTGSYVDVVKLGFLDKDKSWNLFSRIVFGEEGCPIEQQKIGKMIVENCRGLPLSIVVVGGLLAKTKYTREYWEYIGENLNSIVNSEEDERCLKILYLSYYLLPVYLKPCFLYMGVFPEDMKIRVSELIRLWVADGFLKPISGKSPEEVANEYLHELINRNMVLVHQLGCTGNIKYCKIHDLLRDLCLRQAEKERFYNVIRNPGPNVPQDTSIQRRIVIPESASKEEVSTASQFMSPARSLICYAKNIPPLRDLRLLRILSCSHILRGKFRKDVFKLVNSRCLIFKAALGFKFPPSFYLLWNLQTLVVGGKVIAPFDIWNMPKLRHLKLNHGFYLPNVPNGDERWQDGVVLENLQTLGVVVNCKFREEVVKSIPNIKKLAVYYMQERVSEKGSRDYYVNNLGRLHKLESLYCHHTAARGVDYLQNIIFPHSLKKLTLRVNVNWEEKLEKVGSLPFLEKLKLMFGFFESGKWETLEGGFPSLKSLSIKWCSGLKYWTTESSHFPRLEQIVLDEIEELKEIPSEIGEIPTMKSIKLIDCSDSAVVSARKLVADQVEVYGQADLTVRIFAKGFKQIEEMWRLAHPTNHIMF